MSLKIDNLFLKEGLESCAKLCAKVHDKLLQEIKPAIQELKVTNLIWESDTLDLKLLNVNLPKKKPEDDGLILIFF